MSSVTCCWSISRTVPIKKMLDDEFYCFDANFTYIDIHHKSMEKHGYTHSFHGAFVPNHKPGSVDADISEASSLLWRSSHSGGEGDRLINKI